MNILEFNDTFRMYEFGKAILQEYPNGAHLHIALLESAYVVYDADNRQVVDIGNTLKENWINIFSEVFRSEHGIPWIQEESYAPIFITPEAMARCTEGVQRNAIPDIVNALNATVLEVNTAFNNILYCTRAWVCKVEESIGRESKLEQEVYDGYITWALKYKTPTGWSTLMDVRFSNDDIKGYPRSRIRGEVTPRKLTLITQVLGGTDTMLRGISGIEYNFSH